jgi:hypothetical protein
MVYMYISWFAIFLNRYKDAKEYLEKKIRYNPPFFSLNHNPFESMAKKINTVLNVSNLRSKHKEKLSVRFIDIVRILRYSSYF